MNPNYIDCGTIKALLLKVDEWPDVITKQDLHEEGKECIFYGNSSKEHPKDPQDLLKYVIPTIKFNNDPLYPRELNQLKSAVKNNKSDSDSSESESLKSEPEEKIQTVTKKQKKPAKKRELKNAKKQNELAVVLAEAVSESSESNGND